MQWKFHLYPQTHGRTLTLTRQDLFLYSKREREQYTHIHQLEDVFPSNHAWVWTYHADEKKIVLLETGERCSIAQRARFDMTVYVSGRRYSNKVTHISIQTQKHTHTHVHIRFHKHACILLISYGDIFDEYVCGSMMNKQGKREEANSRFGMGYSSAI